MHSAKSYCRSAGTLSKTLEEFFFYCVFDLGGSQRFGLAVALTFFRLLVYTHDLRSHLREGADGGLCGGEDKKSERRDSSNF